MSDKIKRIDIAIDYERKLSYFDFKNIKKIPKHFIHWKKEIKKINPDVMITCNFAFDFYWIPFLFKKILKLKEFHSSRCFDKEIREKASFLKKLNFKIDDFIESKYTKLIILNPDEKKYFENNNIEIIPNPITISTNVTASLVNKRAIAAGRIAPVKGFEKAILSWKIVVEQNPDWCLDIYGDGEQDYIERLKKLIILNKLEKNVFIYNAIKNLDQKLLDYSIYIMSSITECFPMVLLESLAIGLPIVSFDCPTGPRNIITNNEDGFLAENQNIEQLAKKIVILMKDDNLRSKMGINAKQNSLRFSNDVVLKKWQVLFDNYTKKT